MAIEGRNSIEIEICRFCDGGSGEFLGMVRLYPTEDGFGVYARDAQPRGEHDFLQVRGFVTCNPNEHFWLLIEKAMAWTADQMERR